MFSKTCEYGLRATIYIAEQSLNNKTVKITAVSEAIDSPQPFTAKIMQVLTKEGIVKSIKGPNGGFLIEKNNFNTPLSAIVKLLDGDSIYTGCALGLKQCDDSSPCPLHFKFLEIRESLRMLLENTTLLQLLEDLHLKEAILKR